YEFVVALFACMYAGVIAVPAYPPQRHSAFQRLRTIIRNADARLLLIDSKLSKGLTRLIDPQQQHAPAIINVEWIGAAEDAWTMPLSHDLDRPALIQYTSGSTGDAKGVVITHGNIVANSYAIQKKFGHSVKSRGMIWLPPYHDMGLIGGILQPV